MVLLLYFLLYIRRKYRNCGSFRLLVFDGFTRFGMPGTWFYYFYYLYCICLWHKFCGSQKDDERTNNGKPWKNCKSLHFLLDNAGHQSCILVIFLFNITKITRRIRDKINAALVPRGKYGLKIFLSTSIVRDFVRFVWITLCMSCYAAIIVFKIKFTLKLHKTIWNVNF